MQDANYESLMDTITGFLDRLLERVKSSALDEKVDFYADVVTILFSYGIAMCRRAGVPDDEIVVLFEEHVALTKPATVKKGARKCVD